MGRPKNYLRITIGLGAPDSQARIRVEEFIKSHGKRKVSMWIRDCIVNSTDSDAYKKREVIGERKKILKQMNLLHKQLEQNNDTLDALGIDPLDIK